jgi:acyl-CoA synthetase (AMP-forming)/AMP-acid ligase II
MPVCEEIDIRPAQNPDNLIDMLRRQAERNPNKSAFVHLLNGLTDEDTLTYAGLDQRARAIAVHLQNMGLTGERVLLAYPPGLDFIAAFFGCMYANCTAVPIFPPAPSPHSRSLQRRSR